MKDGRKDMKYDKIGLEAQKGSIQICTIIQI